jgi:hypothetical protein
MRTSHFAVLAWVVLAGGWVAACDSDNGPTTGTGGTGPDGGLVTITGCNSIEHEGCSYNNVGCDDNVVGFTATLEDSVNLCEVTVAVECTEGCISSAVVQPGGAGPGPDGGNVIPPGVTTLPFGDPCDTDADCADGMSCLSPTGTDWFGGGPSFGYCTVPCAEDPAVCAQYTNAICVQGSSAAEAYCFEGCSRGPVAKCDGRVDVACFQVGAANAACLPTCGSDSQCPDGRFCDIVSGVCVDDEPQGDPVGTPCDLNGENTCQGFCDDFGGYGLCTGFCTVGLDSPGCGIDPADGVNPGDPFCLPVFSQTDAAGDTGLCIQRCDCNGQCLDSESMCLAWGSADAVELFSSEGICARTVMDAGAGLVCEGEVPPDGGMSSTDAGLDSGTSNPDAGNNPSTPDASTSVDAGDAGDGG